MGDRCRIINVHICTKLSSIWSRYASNESSMGIDDTSTSTTSFSYGDFGTVGNNYTYATTSTPNSRDNGYGGDVCISTSTSCNTNCSRKTKRFGKGTIEVKFANRQVETGQFCT